MRKLRVDNYIIETDLETILNELRLELFNGKLKDIKAKGDNLVVTCPHHDGGHESKPACSVYIGDDEDKEYGMVNCFVCGFKGPFWALVAEACDTSIEKAKSWLIKRYGVLAYEKLDLGDDIRLPAYTGSFRRKKRTINSDSELSNYQSYCPYLAKRKLTRATCENFNVKYDSQYRQVVFPCYDEYGSLLMTPKRSIDTKVFYIDEGKEKPVYCLDRIIKNRTTTAIVTEGPFDTLLANQYGFPTIGTFGNPSDEQIDKISKSCIQILYMMFDNDAAGRSFAAKLRDRLDKRILLVDVKIPNPYKDIGELDYETFWKIVKEYQK